jgi:hypothetical protein
MQLRHFVLTVCERRSIRTPSELARRLVDRGCSVTPQATHAWWTGAAKRFRDTTAHALPGALDLDAEEIDALRSVQSGMPSDVLPPEKGETAAPTEAA